MGANLDSAYPAGVKIAIVMGSKSDWATMQFAADVLTTLNVPFHVEVVSAHRTLTNCSALPNKPIPMAYMSLLQVRAVQLTCRVCWQLKHWCPSSVFRYKVRH